ncbi:4'-phosphopantetheinyl transferase family protein [Thalassotalea insulae]|uniref:4'-phosphopantetheinyl transferase family protein n=1 Tax=Thalassotalea insulae TaxID=2056778 RepID=UPI0024E0F0A4|nr:4'-phosphopantetheinyl transferase superfamily protein [Thalassotalea insulae]
MKEIQQKSLCSHRDSNFITDQTFTYDKKSHIYFFSCHFDNKLYDKTLFNDLQIYYPPELDASVVKRQAEFLAGRISAKETLLRSGLYQSNPPTINIGQQRNPIWPEHLIGSISHTHNHAMCAISLKKHNSCIGIDIENHMSDELADKIGCSIYSEDEIKKLVNEKLSHKLASTLIFSAKESLFKAIYPLVGRYFDFDCATVTKFSLAEKYIYLKVSKAIMNEGINIADEYRCNFILLENSLITTINQRAR